MLERLAENNVLINLVWNYQPTSHEPYYLEWVAHLRRTHRQLKTVNESGEEMTAFCQKLSTLYEPFALWMRELYGDGIYYCETEGNYYFLIISQGVPVSGSDIVVSRRFWMILKEQLAESPEYKDLVFRKITDEHISTVIERCNEHQAKMKKRRQVIIGSLALGGIVLLLTVMVLLKVFIRG
jgi:hypothetical protein